jgi:DegV family protein with EDD domain
LEVKPTVKLVTDTAADLPPEVVKDLEITVIPLNVQFGRETYKDRVDLTAEDFYHKLENSATLPTTSAPSPGLFADVFDNLAIKHSQILGVFLSRKFSATYDSAVQGVKLMKRRCQVEIVDSTLGIMGQGLLVMEAAKKALTGASLSELVGMISENIPRTHIRATLDTLKYLARGGRIGKVQALMGAMLKMNPILGIKDGEAFPFARVRSRAKATDWLYEFASKFSHVKALAVEYGNNATEAKALAKRIAAVFPKVPIYLSNVSPVIGTHAGPNILAVTVMEE